jgi:hypothetical protein
MTGTHTPEYMREYRRKRVIALREEFSPKGECEHCGSTENLEWDHIDPDTKVANVGHMIAECASRAKIMAEIAKCRVLCHGCNILAGRNTKISDELVKKIRKAKGSQREIAKRFGVSQPHVGKIRAGESR